MMRISNNKKSLSLLLSAAICFVCLTSCGGGGSTSSGSASSSSASGSGSASSSAAPSQVTNIKLGDAERHEFLLPLEFEDGEVCDNPYYKRASSADGVPSYVVMQASNKQLAYLPLSETVVYPTEDGPCYYERKTLTYQVDGEPVTVTRYELWVNTLAPQAGGDTAQAEDAADAVSGDTSQPADSSAD